MSEVTCQPVPADDPIRMLVVAQADSLDEVHVGLAGNTYTTFVSSEQAAGQYCPMDMHIVPRGGPPHRHDFEEMFTTRDGEVQFMFRSETATVSPGTALDVPENSPDTFRNVSGKPIRMLCMCKPGGEDGFFVDV
jgi:mannose-6-phosphate isomerase-like protein (cupin superfamily)